MAEEPKQVDRSAQGNELWDTTWDKVKKFSGGSPTFVLTLVYLYATAIGIVYSRILYARFGINIFDYSEIADFLVAAFKNPATFLLAGVVAAMGSIVLASRARVEKALARGEVSPIRERELGGLIQVRMRTARAALIFALIFVFSSLILPYYSASKTASSIKHGQYPAVDVRYRSFSGTAGQVTKPGLELIGSTQKAVY